MPNITTLEPKRLERSRILEMSKLSDELHYILMMLETLQTKEMIEVKSYCLVNDIIDVHIYDNALMERHDTIRLKMLELKQ